MIKIISKYFTLPCGAKATQHFKPKITIKPKTTNTTERANVSEQVSRPVTIRRHDEMTGLDLLAEQNRVLLNNSQYRGRNLPQVYKYTFGNPGITSLQLSRECQYFQNITGAELHIPSLQAVDYKFAEACSLLERCAREGNFPKNIKHVIVGHGMGSSINGDWQIINGGGYVLNYINRNIPKGEKVLVLSCEKGAKFSGKYGIGDEVELSLMNMNKPAKIVESGKNEIIGDLYFPPRLINQDIFKPCVTYYDVSKPQMTIKKL